MGDNCKKFKKEKIAIEIFEENHRKKKRLLKVDLSNQGPEKSKGALKLLCGTNSHLILFFHFNYK